MIELEAPSATQPAHVPPAFRPRRRSSRILGWIAVATVSALVGAGCALAVARATGWGSTVTVNRYVSNSRSVAEQPANVHGLLVGVLPSVVAITATSTQTGPFRGFGESTVTAKGTGMIITSGGQILTNDHVVAGASSVTVTLNGATAAISARIVGEDSSHDLALLSIEHSGALPTVTFGNSSSVTVGDGVIAVGYALGLPGDPSVTAGIISATNRKASSQTDAGTTETLSGLLQTDAPISSGNSGGPLIDSAGKVIGVTTMVATSSGENSANGVAFAISSKTVTSLLPQLRKGS